MKLNIYNNLCINFFKIFKFIFDDNYFNKYEKILYNYNIIFMDIDDFFKN